ncbi:MAG: EAL domain-containing protein [Rhodospirillaceae bacterium]|nr:EAL domain-containing protein [Rhodospirillaceae bacterium]
MSEPAVALAGKAGGAKPLDLRALVHDMGRWRQTPEPGVNLIVISVSSALPEAKRTATLVDHLAEGVTVISTKRSGTLYQVSTCDFGIMVKVNEAGLVSLVRDLKVEMLRTIERNFPGSFGTIDQSRLVLSYDLAHNYRSAADRVAKFAELAQRAAEGSEDDKKLRALTHADIKRVMAAYEKFGTEKFVKAFIRHQDTVVRKDGQAMKPAMTEYFISMDLIRKPLFVDVEMRGSGRLFNEFTLVLDQIMLQAFNQMATPDTPCSINLNVESVFTQAFETFIEQTPAEKLKRVVFEFRQSNIVENFDEFQIARGLIRSKGATIAVDQIFPQTVGLVDLEYIGASMCKIHWRQGAEDILKERQRAIKYIQDCNVTPILIRVDADKALDVGKAMGITMYQGFLIDDMMKTQAA